MKIKIQFCLFKKQPDLASYYIFQLRVNAEIGNNAFMETRNCNGEM